LGLVCISDKSVFLIQKKKVFTVLEGAVSVHVHRTTFVVAPHGMFWIPRGAYQNQFSPTSNLQGEMKTIGLGY
jgi:mannose-6-phosphate isomerase-like protein (cupin superfamily)